MSDRVCALRADTGFCGCATGCAAKQIDEMREARDRAEIALRNAQALDADLRAYDLGHPWFVAADATGPSGERP